MEQTTKADSEAVVTLRIRNIEKDVARHTKLFNGDDKDGGMVADVKAVKSIVENMVKTQRVVVVGVGLIVVETIFRYVIQ